jgi:hypothetical protein
MQQRYKLIITGFLFVYTLSLFLPGAYSIDSWHQWNEVTTKHYDDWYGTGLATTWRWLWLLTGNYMCLYVAQMLLYWTFITLLLWQVNFRSFAYWLGIGGALFFCFIPQYVMRDSLTVLDWGLAALFLTYATQIDKHRRLLAIIALLLLAHGLWVRINAVIAFLPLAYIAILLLEKNKMAVWKRWFITIAAGIVLIAGIQFFTYNVEKAERTFPDYKLKLLDLSGISKLSGENCFPPAITDFPAFNLDTLYARYTPASIDDIYWPTNTKPIFPYPNDTLENAVSKSWNSAIRRHPVDYLRNRVDGFLYYLRIRKRFQWDQYWNVAAFFVFPDNPLSLKGENTFLRRKITAAYGHFYRTPIYDPWFWLLLNIAAFVLFAYNYRKKPRSDRQHWLIHAGIQLSGILFLFSQLLVYQHDRDFRYSYWNVFVAFLAFAGIFAKRQRAGFSPAP